MINLFLLQIKLQNVFRKSVYNNEQFGWIEVICGSMFSGKTEELIRHQRAKIANQKLKSLNQLLTQEVKILLNHMMKVSLNV